MLFGNIIIPPKKAVKEEVIELEIKPKTPKKKIVSPKRKVSRSPGSAGKKKKTIVKKKKPILNIKDYPIPPLEFIGVDESPINVARSHLIMQMLKDNNVSVQNIFEIWFCSCISTDTYMAMMSSLSKLLKIPSPSWAEDKDEHKVGNFLNRWFATSNLSASKAK